METFALGIDIGGTGTAFGVVHRNGEIVSRGEIPTRGYATLHDYIDAIRTAVTPMLDMVGREKLAGCGVGAPSVNYHTGEIVHAPNLPWHGIIPLKMLLNESLGMKVTITNDAKAAAIGEMTYGAAKGMKDFIMLTLGTGVGSGFVANGQLIYGHDGFAGELGHVIAVRDGRKCGCGRNGCLETYASATGICRTARQWLAERTEDSVLRKKEQIAAIDIQEAARNGDALALEMFDFTGKILGQTLADAIAITSPQAVVFFGGLAGAGDLIINPVRRYMEESLLEVFRNRVQLLQSGLPGADAAILGASAIAW